MAVASMVFEIKQSQNPFRDEEQVVAYVDDRLSLAIHSCSSPSSPYAFKAYRSTTLTDYCSHGMMGKWQ